ncbi:5'-nucleotidase, lipoprotein e(P4) family [Consotaella aegiceratis]|uniref:5'-nucleotidase, lipoprotein e(P4) family n=1 Tax=Consotaella aegiceratis TaxID=3097961 RepID=UPI002F40934E
MKRTILLAASFGSAVAFMPALAVAQDAKTDEAAMETTPQNDILNAALWMQNSVEYKANSMAVYALAKLKLDDALADTAASALDQTDAADLPTAIIIDLDETAIDNSAYESGLVTTGTDYSSKTWAEWTSAKEAKAVPGALDYLQYADSKGVKVFYVSNRKTAEEEATRANLEALGFPMGGNVDTVLTRDEKEDWGSDKQTRRDFVSKDYRVVAMLGDNFNDFTSDAGGSPEERLAAFEKMQDHFTKDWFMLANPTYGSWESAPFGSDYSLSVDQRRAKKIEALEPWEPSGETAQ